MTLKEAIALALHVRRAREIAGMHTDVPYSQIQLVDALAVIVTAVGENPVTRDEHTKTARQLTAAYARLAKHGEKHSGATGA